MVAADDNTSWWVTVDASGSTGWARWDPPSFPPSAPPGPTGRTHGKVVALFIGAMPNFSRNLTRWSVDIRLQDASEPTLRTERGFVLGSGSGGVRSAADWATATPSKRLSEARAAVSQPLLGGNGWARQHVDANSLKTAVELERERYVQ